MLAKAAETLPTNGSPFVAEAGNMSATRKASRAQDAGASPPRQPAHMAQQKVASRKEKENGEQKRVDPEPEQDVGQAENGTKKKTRRGQKKKALPIVPTSSGPPAVMNSEVSRNGNDMNGSIKRDKGWRQTPLLQPTVQSTSPAAKAGAKKQTRRQRDHDQAMQNGWATEDASEVQDMGDFDFEASNKLFDKKGVFDQLRQDDTTADEDRLVSHNKVPRPGTYGGKNLHPTENVLSPKLAPKHRSDEASSASDTDTELGLGMVNVRSSSKHSMTRVGLGLKQTSRQNSLQVDGKPHPLTASMSSDRGGLSRSITSLSGRAAKQVPSIATASPRPDRTHSPHSILSATVRMPAPLSAVAQDPRFVLQQTLATCPVLLPSALETLETETVSRYGLAYDAITESAARCIAEMAMNMFDPFGSRRGSRANTMRGSMSSSMMLDRTSTPVIVIMAGNNALGARAVAAGRHLTSRHCKIIIAEQQYESTETHDPQMRTQVAILKRMQRAGASIKRGPWKKALNYIKNLTGPPAVIIDALLGGSTYESLLDANAQHAAELQKEARDMIDWANKSRAPVLSAGLPSGVSGIDGSATVVEGEPLAVRPEKVLALGAPMQGLLEAVKGGERWDVSLADIGINITLRSDEAVVFGAQWVTELRLVEEDAATEVT